MKPEDLREEGNWLAQLKTILGVPQGPGDQPESKHRSTKSAVKELFTNLQKGAADQPVNGNVDKILFNAVDLLVGDKEDTSKKGKSRRVVLERFQTEFARQSKDFKKLDETWKKKIGESLQALVAEEDDKAAADDLFDDLATLNLGESPDIKINKVIQARVATETHKGTKQFDVYHLESLGRAIKAKDGVDPLLKARAEKLVESHLAMHALHHETDTLDEMDVTGAVTKKAKELYPDDTELEGLQKFKKILEFTGPIGGKDASDGFKEIFKTLIHETGTKQAVEELEDDDDLTDEQSAKPAITKKAQELSPGASLLSALERLGEGLVKEKSGKAKWAQELIDDERQRAADEQDDLTNSSVTELIKGLPDRKEAKTFDYQKLVSESFAELEKENNTAKTGKSKFEILAHFADGMETSVKKSGKLGAAGRKKLREAIQTMMVAEFDRWDTYKKARENCKMPAEDMWARPDIRKALKAANPVVCGTVLSALDPEVAKDIDFDEEFGDDAPKIIGESLKALARKGNPRDAKDGEIKRQQQLDPKLFTLLKGKVTTDEWNDPRTGLGPRVCQLLWANANYDQVCDLVNSGVDTTRSTRAVGLADKEVGRADGCYSGFVQPLQHIVAKYLPKVGKLPEEDEAPDDLTDEGRKIRGAKKVFDTLASLQKANKDKINWDPNKICSVTNWEDVKGSEMIDAFKENPGTIWGFEDIRLPFVQAAHETQVGNKKAQPLRMMELWSAAAKGFSAQDFEEMHRDPDTQIAKRIHDAVGELKIEQFPGVEVDDWENLVKNFEKDAESFLRDHMTQLPKLTVTHQGSDQQTVSGLSGIEVGKHQGGIACKAGLWWAKKEKQPVYYCLDGINMKDVVNYKKVKAASVQSFITSGGGKVEPEQGKGHAETITMVEMREILKKWDELKDTVVFIDKGKVMEDPDDWAKKWKKKMEDSDAKVGRIPAQPRAVFAERLNAIDKGLEPLLKVKAEKTEDVTDDKTNRKIDWEKEADMDARDIVKKSGYLIKIAKTRRSLALQYIVDRCGVLVQYGLLSDGLAVAASNLQAIYNGGDGSVSKARKAVQAEIKKCLAAFQAPLTSALLAKAE